MVDVAIATPTAHHKVKAHTRRQIHRQRELERREAKALVRAARPTFYEEKKLSRSLAVFEGCDPLRTLALLGEEF